MGITSAGNAKQGTGAGDMRAQNDAIQQNTTVHYLVSPPRPPRKTNPQAKATF
ncbi:hypothetical protein KCP75_16205 [Salmonella enterica subsp. enterica]|nr:hypothetical protein KCP75_16205 [Salmonella enterica subsp. enterica]